MSTICHLEVICGCSPELSFTRKRFLKKSSEMSMAPVQSVTHVDIHLLFNHSSSEASVSVSASKHSWYTQWTLGDIQRAKVCLQHVFFLGKNMSKIFKNGMFFFMGPHKWEFVTQLRTTHLICGYQMWQFLELHLFDFFWLFSTKMRCLLSGWKIE